MIAQHRNSPTTNPLSQNSLQGWRQRFRCFFHSFNSDCHSYSQFVSVLQLPSSSTFRCCLNSAHSCQTLFICMYKHCNLDFGMSPCAGKLRCGFTLLMMFVLMWQKYDTSSLNDLKQWYMFFLFFSPGLHGWSMCRGDRRWTLPFRR